jgi:opacity protein-like surface antigen
MNRSFLLAAALTAFAAPAFAAPVTVNINPGYAIPIGPYSDVLKNSLMIQASAETPITKELSAGLEAGWTSPNLAGTLTTFKTVTFTSDMNLTSWQITPFARYSLAPKEVAGKSVTPYGVLGAGIYVNSTSAGTFTFSDSSTVPFSGLNSVVHFGFNAGIGASMDMATNFAVGLDLRYHMYLTKTDANRDGSNRDPVDWFVPSLRLSYKFGS